MSEQSQPIAGPPMLDLTSMTKKPPMRQAIPTVGFVQVRHLVAFFVSLLLTAPLWMTLWFTTLRSMSIILAILAGLAGVGLSNFRPSGQPILSYLRQKAFSHLRKVEIEGKKRRVYVGVAPVRDPHVGQKFIYASSSVDVNPEHFDERGAFRKRE